MSSLVRKWNVNRGKPSCAVAAMLSVDTLLVAVLPAYLLVCVHLLLTDGSSGVFSGIGESEPDVCQRELTVALMLAYPCMLAMVAYFYVRPAGVLSFVLTLLMTVAHALLIGNFASSGCASASSSSAWSLLRFCLFLLSFARVLIQTVDNSACIQDDDRQPVPASALDRFVRSEDPPPAAAKQQTDAAALAVQEHDTQTQQQLLHPVQLTRSTSSASVCTPAVVTSPLVAECAITGAAVETAGASCADLYVDLCAMCCCPFDSEAAEYTISSASQLLRSGSPEPRARVVLHQCAHSYHAQCISSYYRQHGSCPACRGHLPLLCEHTPAQSIASTSGSSEQVDDCVV